jgi:hypothetical protein
VVADRSPSNNFRSRIFVGRVDGLGLSAVFDELMAELFDLRLRPGEPDCDGKATNAMQAREPPIVVLGEVVQEGLEPEL